MDVLVRVVGSLVSKAAEYTVDPTARQLSYLFKPRSKFLNLRSKVQDLKDARERVQQSVEVATRKGEVIFDDVQRWLTVANEKISEEAATQLQEDEEKAMKRCFAELCPDFKSSYPLSKKAEKEANAIAQLLTQKDAFKEVSYLPALEVTDLIRPVKEYEAFRSRSGAFNGVMEALEDDTVSIIGVYGMGGVGKTTLVKEVAGRAKVKLSFDEVVLVTIKQEPNMKNIQKEIAEKLGMQICEENIEGRAARLRKRLQKEKRVLVILDDIWVTLDLEALGISSRDEHKGCKILVTSRWLHVLESLNSHKNISIKTLEEDEAWNLFKKLAGHVVESSDIRSIAVEVAKKCAGLPIAISTIAKALKPKEKLFEWRDALRQLSNPSKRNFEGIPADAYSAIELSYKFLEAKELGPIFLLCSIMGHNADVEDLLRYAIGLGFIHDVNTMEESRDRILTLINNLKASCLLLEGSHPNCFDMHDVVRDVAQSIASRDRHWLALFKEWPDEEKMKESQLMSLQNAKVSELLNHELDCPALNYFSIGVEDNSSLKISNDFFKGMQRLKVLEFVQTHFTSLPSSIGSLKTLCTLRLIDCVLKDIVILGELRNLEILDLHKSRLEMLPKEIEQLTKLKLLDLSDCFNLQVIPPNVFSKLSKLEELYLYHSFDEWEVDGIDSSRRKASLVELQHLSHLTTLEVHIPNVQAIPKDYLFLEKMDSFKISIGHDKWRFYNDSGIETSKMLKLMMNTSIHLVDGICKLLSKKIESLCLHGMKNVGEVLCGRNTESFEQLRFIQVKNCNMLKNLFLFSIAERLHQLEEFKISCPNLEELYLDSVSGIEKIWHIDDRFSGMSFGVQSLTRLKVSRCHKLKCVFTSSMVKNLVHLKTLEVSECHEMEGVIEGTLAATEEERINGHISVFPKLETLQLIRLPRLKVFCCRDLNAFTFDNGESRAASPHHLFNEKVSCPTLKVLYLDSMNGIEKIWHIDDQFSGMCFGEQCLTSLTVKKCYKLKCVFTSSMVKSFVNLKTLEVSHCDELEGVIEGVLAATEEERVFPKLDSLELKYLSNLKRFCHGNNPIEFPSLRSLEIWDCHDLNTFTFDNGKSRTEPPQYLFNGKLLCPALEELKVKECQKLKYVFTSSIVKSFVHLQTLEVSDCDEMEGVIEGVLPATEEEEGVSETIRVFPTLNSLKLLRLPKLKRFCRGINPIEFPSLRSLKISKCHDLNTFAFNNGNSRAVQPHYLFNEKVILPALEKLTFDGMDNLERIWPNQLAQHSFSRLTSIGLWDCPKLLNVFPLSMLTGFQRLNRVIIAFCKSLEEIISDSQRGGSSSAMTSHSSPFIQSAVNEFEFPNVTFLCLYSLPSLRSIHHKMLTINWPSLNMLVVGKCDKVEMLFSSQETSGNTNQQPLFWVNKSTFPNLHELTLGWNAGQQQQQLLSRYFLNLKVIKLVDYPEQITVLSSYMFEILSLPNIQTLEIRMSYFREMRFQSEEGGEEKPASLLLSQITELRLETIPSLMHLWKEKEGFPNLRILNVNKCPQLKGNLVPSSVSFRNLVTLEVRGCDGIKKLITHSTAKSLLQLKEMRISHCENIEEIIQGGGDDDHDEISFPQLKCLKLNYLPKLESFCSSGNYTFEFPSLEDLFVHICRNMKTFSEGHSNSPMLHKVQSHECIIEEHWEGSLNSTIQQLFRENNRERMIM